LQSHYRSTLDFGNEALQGSEKALKRLWEAYENLGQLANKQLAIGNWEEEAGTELDIKINKLIAEFTEFMNDDLNTAKVIANMFELVPIINGLKGGQIKPEEISASTIAILYAAMKTWIEDILGLQNPGGDSADNGKLDGVMQVLIDLRKQARARKDWATSDAIRNQLATIGIQLKDEKDGSMSYSI
jgi:cysteinyl-tRNA synthetase